MMDFDFVPPQLPVVLSGERFINYANVMQFETDDEETRQVALALDAYNCAQQEYNLRDMHYSAWLAWYREHPEDGDRVLAFATDHSAQFASACRAFEALDQALVRWEKRSRTTDIRALFEPTAQKNKQEAPRLAEQLAAMQAVLAPSPASQPQSAASLPQKRARP